MEHFIYKRIIDKIGKMNLGFLIIIISILGSISNWLNWRYLNYSIVRLLYYLGALVHEISHAIFAILTGAKILEFKVFSSQPQVIHSKPKLPFLGQMLISLAPIIGGIFFLFVIDHFLLKDYFTLPQFTNIQSIPNTLIKIFTQINLLSWKNWLMILLFLNVGAMISPSWQDLKNIWPAIIILLFFSNSSLAYFSLLAIILIIINIFIQFILILTTKIIKIVF